MLQYQNAEMLECLDYGMVSRAHGTWRCVCFSGCMDLLRWKHKYAWLDYYYFLSFFFKIIESIMHVR